MSKNRGPVNKNSMEGIALVDPPVRADRWSPLDDLFGHIWPPEPTPFLCQSPF